MFEMETRLRRSEEWQKVYRNFWRVAQGGFVEGLIQRTVLAHFGFCATSESVDEYRRLHAFFKGNKRVEDANLAIRLNGMHFGMIEKRGDSLVNVPLVLLESGARTSLSELLERAEGIGKQHLVIMAGSST
jgi:hypothetical protein